MIIDKIKYALKKERMSLIFFITNKCNLRCMHCFNWKQLDNKDIELSLDEINDFSKQLGKLNDVSISGGEPMLRKDLPEIYRIFVEKNKINSFTVPTNGTFPQLTREHIERMVLMDYNTKINVALSLDGPRDIHDKIRGIKGTYEKVFKTYKQLEELKKKYGIGIRVATVISNQNIKHIPELIKDVKERMPSLDFHNFEILRGSPRDPGQKAPSVKDLKNIRKMIFKVWEKYSFYGNKSFASRVALALKKYAFDSYIKTIELNKIINPCYVNKVYFVLDHNGDLRFCELLGVIGNIRENTVEEILGSKRAMHQSKIIKKCYCTHSCFQQRNIMLNPLLYPKIMSYLK